MKIVSLEQLHDYSENTALFFTAEGIVVDQLSRSPLLKFQSTVTELNLNIKVVYLDGQLLIVQCTLLINLSQFHIYPVKAFLTEVSDKVQYHIIRAFHWLTWNERYQCCSRCGGKLNKVGDLIEKKCSVCQLLFYPNLSPAVMVLVQKDQQILLARSPHFKPGVYSALAGFIEMAESAEETVYREVKEEVGIEVTQLEYFGSQSWPFPNSFMFAFTAQYLSGELVLEPNEIEDAKWFDIDNLPDLPSYPSISRKLIDSVVNKKG